MNFYLEPGEAPKATTAEQLVRLKTGLERVTAAAGPLQRLENIASPVAPTDSRLRAVDHPRAKAFSLLGVPDDMGPTLSCEVQAAGGAPPAAGDEQSYGKYFVVALRLTQSSGVGPVLALAWARDERGWRIYAFKIIES